MSMKNVYKKGDIILVKYPFTNLIEFKVRPAVILRDQSDNDVIVLPISTTMYKQKYDLRIDNDFYKEKPLPVESIVRIGKIMTIESDLVVKKISSFKKEFFACIQKALIQYLQFR